MMIDIFFAKIERLIPARWRWILSHEGFKRYFSNTGWMFFGQFLSLVLSFLIGTWVARYLGPENYGIINYAAAFVGVFGFIAGLGVDGLVSRDLVRTPEAENELMGTGFVLKMIGGLSAFAAVLIADYFIVATPLTHFLILLYGLSFFIGPLGIIGIYFQSKVQAKNNVRASIGAALISSTLKIGFIFSGLGLAWLVLIYVFDTVWQTIGLVYAYRKGGHLFSAWKFDQTLAGRLWRDGWPLMLSGAASYIYLRIDQVMIGRMLGSVQVGLYAAAVKITEIWYFVPTIICGSLFPAIVNAKKKDSRSYRRRLNNLYWLMTAASVGIALPVSFLAKLIINILYGAGYLASIPVLQIYVWSGIGMFLGAAVNNYLMVEARSKMIFISNFVAMTINIALNLLFIPRFGLIGSALATLVSYFVLPAIVLSERFIRIQTR